MLEERVFWEMLELGWNFFVVGEVLEVEVRCWCLVWFKGTPGRGFWG